MMMTPYPSILVMIFMMVQVTADNVNPSLSMCRLSSHVGINNGRQPVCSSGSGVAENSLVEDSMETVELNVCLEDWMLSTNNNTNAHTRQPHNCCPQSNNNPQNKTNTSQCGIWNQNTSNQTSTVYLIVGLLL